MRPNFNSFPHQNQSNASAAPGPQQVLSSNMLQNSMPVQPQMGMINPQIPFPFNNSSVHLANGQAMAMAMPNMPPPFLTQPSFMNALNPLLFSQNNHLGGPQLGPMSQPGVPNNMNNLPMFPVNGQFCNMPQNAAQGQMFRPNLTNLPQQLNQNMSVPNGQLCLQNALQNMNQLMAMQMLNPAFFGNPQFGLVPCNGVGQQQVNQNQQNFVQPTMDVNASKPLPVAAQKVQGNSCIQPQQNQNLQNQNLQNQNLQPSAFPRPQGNPVVNGQGDVSNSNWKNGPGKNFTRNQKRESPAGFQKSQFHHGDNAKRKFGLHNDHNGKGHGNEKTENFGQANHMNQPKEKKRSLAFNYTEQEIQQWREERKKSYPTKAYINKKLAEKQANSEVTDREAKIRREQLKEILAKQAELGVEVAEIPSYYLLDSRRQAHGSEENRRQSAKQVHGREENTRSLAEQVHGKEENTKPFAKRGRFQNKRDRRGRNNRKDTFAKGKNSSYKDSTNTSSKPTLLQKLLSADIKRDKNRLLQVFRFMVVNSFFKDWPETTLKFPLVTAKESGGGVLEEKLLPLLEGKDFSEGSSSRTTTGENFDYDDDNIEMQNNNINAFEDDDGDEQMTLCVEGKGGFSELQAIPEEEEGEIID